MNHWKTVVGAGIVLVSAMPLIAQNGDADRSVDSAVIGMYSAASRDQTALQNQQDAATRDADNQAFWSSWDSFNQRAMQRAIQRERDEAAALAACRRTTQGCTGRFTPGTGHPGVTFLSRELGKTPQQQARIATLATGYLGTYRQVEAHLVLPTNDIAGPMAYAFLTAMKVYAGESPGIARPVTQIVVGQAREMIANSGRIALLNNHQRHEPAEALAINGVYLATEFTEAQRTGDAARMARTRQLAGQVVRSITGVDPVGLAVTSRGVIETGVTARPGRTTIVAPVLDATTTTRFVWNPAATVNRNNSGLVAQFNQMLRQRGGDPNDLGWGLAGSFAIFYYLAQGVELDSRQLAGTARTLGQLYLESDAGARSTDRDRQQLYERVSAEAMALLSGVQRAQSGGYDEYSRGNIVRGAQESARNALRSYLVPYSLSDFDMTPDGLVKQR